MRTVVFRVLVALAFGQVLHASPTVTGVVNAATLRPSPVAPGELICVLGTGFIEGHTQVTVGALPGTIYVVTSTRITLSVPIDLKSRTTALRVSVDGAGSATMAMAAGDASPGVFRAETALFDAQPPHNQDGTLNLPSTPAPGGSIISVWATGLGHTQWPTQPAPPPSRPPRRPVRPITASIGGAQAVIVGVEEAPSSVIGILRLDIQVPGSIAGGLQPLIVSAGGQASPPVYISLPADPPVNTDVSLARVGAVDLAYDPFRHVLWASTADATKSADPGNPSPAEPQSLLMINPVTRATKAAIPLGSSAYRLALSSNGRYLWLAMADNTVRRLNLETTTIEFSVDLKKLAVDAVPSLAPVVTGPLVAVLAPSPTDEEVLLISFMETGYPIVALRGGEPMRLAGPGDQHIIFNSDGTFWTENHLVGMTPDGPQVQTALPIHSGRSAPIMLGMDGLFLDTDLNVRRSSDLHIVGCLDSGVSSISNNVAPGAVYVPEKGSVYFGGMASGPTNYTILAFDLKTMLPTAQFYFPFFGAPAEKVPNQGVPARLVSLGPEGFASVFSDPTPGGANGGAIFFTPYSMLQAFSWNGNVPAQPRMGQYRKFAFPASYGAVDPTSGLVYLSVPGTVPVIGNSIVPFDPATGKVGQPTWIGSEPGASVVSADGRYLHAYCDGSHSVRRLRLPDLDIDGEFSVYNDEGLPDSASQVLNVPGAPSTTVAAQRFTVVYLVDDDGVAIYDNGTSRAKTTASSPFQFAWSAQLSGSGQYLFAVGDEDWAFRRWHITPDGLEPDAEKVGLFQGYYLALRCFVAQTERCVTNNGFMIDPYSMTGIGLFKTRIGAMDQFSATTVVAVDPGNDRIYFLGNDTYGTPVESFSISTMQPTGSFGVDLGQENAAQMELLPGGELLILSSSSIRILPANLIR